MIGWLFLLCFFFCSGPQRKRVFPPLPLQWILKLGVEVLSDLATSDPIPYYEAVLRSLQNDDSDFANSVDDNNNDSSDKKKRRNLKAVVRKLDQVIEFAREKSVQVLIAEMK